jgi:hypothetical protein
MVFRRSGVSASLIVEISRFRARLAAVDAAALSGPEAMALAAAIASLANACVATRGRLASHAAACGAHREAGYADAAEWLSRVAGVLPNQARREIELARSLDGACASTRQAFDAGDVSFAQAEEIARTERECSGTEAELLPMCRTAALRKLKERARAVREQAMSDEELQRRRRKVRCHRSWIDELGMMCYSGRMMPEEGAPFFARVDAETKRVAKEAEKRGDAREPWDARAADAFARIVTRSRGGKGSYADVIFVCDLSAGRRGYAIEGEACRIVGGPRVPVSVVIEEVERDAFVKLALHNGKMVQLVSHFGRYITAEVRSALRLGAPPLFDGEECSCGCGARKGLHRDHINPLTNGGPTKMANLQSLRPVEHREKTERERAAGLFDHATAATA